MKIFEKFGLAITGAACTLLAASPAWAADMIKAPDIAAQATMVNKGDTSWMLTSSVLVLMMSIPGLALFYGGLVRTKNMLSVLMQVFMIVSIAGLVWCCWGYTMAFTSGSPFVGGFLIPVRVMVLDEDLDAAKAVVAQ